MVFAIVLGGVGAAGLLLAVSGWMPAPVRPAGRRPQVNLRLDPIEVLVPVAAAVVTLLVTRQPAAAVIGAMAGRLVVQWRARPPDEAARAEAIALWTEGLRNAVGAADGVETVLADSARHAPQLIRADIQRMVNRLPYEPIDTVLADRRGALAHPSADQVFRALAQGANEGGSLQGVLDRLAKQARGLAEMYRRIEVAREQPRSTMRTVTVAIAAFTGLLFLGAQDWMSAYATPTGQLILLAVAGWFAFWYRHMSRMARPQTIDRFYAGRSER